ncbi:hypothetical protein N8891_05905 [Flavobacteriales bacterium]|nr:hypothetical protein [Flavobacteriales bacterium]
MPIKSTLVKKFAGAILGMCIGLIPVKAQRVFGPKGWHQDANCEVHEGCGHGLEGIPLDAFTQVPPPDFFSPNAVREANIIVNYNAFPAEVIMAFDYAVDIWSVLLTSNVTIRIDATWEDLESGALAQAGPNNLHQNFANAPFSDTFYPAALANAIVDTDLSEQSDITCSFNSTSNWYFGTDGETPAGQYDFVTAALHEIGHGLGFIGSAYFTNGFGFLGTANTPYAYDQFTETADSIALLNLPNGSQTLGGALTSNEVYWNGAAGMDAVGGGRPRLYAPTNYQPGSSYSHLNESTYPAGSPNSLMTPAINTAESNHNPGPAMLGMFEDMGWVIGGCLITEVVLGEQSECNNDTYTQEIIVTYQAAPNTGLISVNGTLYSLTESPKTVVLNGLPANGIPVDLTVFFTSAPDCQVLISDAFLAPLACYCATDLNGSGLTEIQDILLLLADFGCTSNCEADVTGDGASSVQDVLAMLAAFGEVCPS